MLPFGSPAAPMAALTFALAACATLAPDPAAQASLVEAERAFARMAAQRGVRAAFLANFAPGGLMFVPAPTPVHEVFAQPPADPMATLLAWAPVASGVARSGDFGYSTGPATMARRDGSRPPAHSTFFSVWRREGTGPWRVVLDAGVATPGPVADGELLPAPAVRAAAPGAVATLDAVLAEERAGRWTPAAVAGRLAPDALLQRAGALPLTGAGRIAAAWPAHDEVLAPAGGDVAASGDLAYTYGTVRSTQGEGHYVHLWTRDATGTSWRLAVLLRLP